MDDIIVFQLLKTKRRLTFDILYQREDTRYRGEDDGPFWTFRASNGVEVISRSRMDIQTDRLWLLGASEDERSGSMVFSSDEKRDRAYENFLVALREWVTFIRTGGWGTRPTPELVVPVVPHPEGVECAENGPKSPLDAQLLPEQVEKDVGMLHSSGFATEADAAALLGLDTTTLRARIAARAVFALPERRKDEWRIPVWALHLDMMGVPTLNFQDIAKGVDAWEIHAFMSTPCSSLHGLRPFECLVSKEHLPLKLRAMRDALASKLKLDAHSSMVDVVVDALRQDILERSGEGRDPDLVRHGRGSWES